MKSSEIIIINEESRKIDRNVGFLVAVVSVVTFSQCFFVMSQTISRTMFKMLEKPFPTSHIPPNKKKPSKDSVVSFYLSCFAFLSPI
jgi:hypothetical protein